MSAEAEPRVSAKRLERLLEERHGLRWNERTVRRFVQEVRGSLRPPEAFVHRTHLPGETMEIDFGEAWAAVQGRKTKVFFFVATLPASNTYFSKAYRFQRIECLLDGITSALEWFGGLPKRLVFDNATTAVKKVLKGEARVETEQFHAYRAEWPLGVEFCSPASGWEKDSAERGVEYVRGLALRPAPVVESLEKLNTQILRELEIDLDRRRLRDGRSAREALEEERGSLCRCRSFGRVRRRSWPARRTSALMSASTARRTRCRRGWPARR
jgi:transposase